MLDFSIFHMNRFDPEIILTKHMYEIGMSPHLDGFHYFRTGILICFQENTAFTSRSIRPLYEKIAERTGAKTACIERSVRNLISRTWVCTQQESVIWFGTEFTARPANSKVMAAALTWLRTQKEAFTE